MAFYNLVIQQGDMGTSSVQVSMEITLSARPIRIPIKERYAPSQVNWVEYRRICDEYVPGNLDHGNGQDIDNEVTRLQRHLQNAKERVTPKITSRTIPAMRTTPLIRRTRATIIFDVLTLTRQNAR